MLTFTLLQRNSRGRTGLDELSAETGSADAQGGHWVDSGGAAGVQRSEMPPKRTHLDEILEEQFRRDMEAAAEAPNVVLV